MAREQIISTSSSSLITQTHTTRHHHHHHQTPPDSDSNSIANHSVGHGRPSSRIKKQQQQRHQLLRTKLSSSLSILGLFIFYIGHDALQERMFRLDGFAYGFFMTLVEVVVMLLLASVIIHDDGEDTHSPGKGKQMRHDSISPPPPPQPQLSTATILRIAWVGLLLALAHGLGNTSLNYSPYPLKVAFKSCKLVPTMAVGACLTYDRRYTALQYTAALIMGFGLAVLSSADTTTTTTTTASHDESSSESRILVAVEGDATSSLPNNNTNDHHLNNSSSWHDAILPHLGPLLLAISTALDSAVPNIQEQLLRSKRVRTSDMIRISNGVMCACLAAYTYLSGEFSSAWKYCARRRDASLTLLLQGTCAYFGLRCYLSIIREYGGVVGVLLANARKVITIVLSFVLFSKPFNERHVAGLVLVGIGVYLGCISKTTTTEKQKKRGRWMKGDEDISRKASNDDEDDEAVNLLNGDEEAINKLHEHSV